MINSETHFRILGEPFEEGSQGVVSVNTTHGQMPVEEAATLLRKNTMRAGSHHKTTCHWHWYESERPCTCEEAK